MKTRKILAASTAALLAFGTTAVIASAAQGSQGSSAAPGPSDIADVDCSTGDLGKNLYGISFDGGDTYQVTGLKTAGKDADGEENAAWTAAAVEALVDANEAKFKKVYDTDLTVSIALKDAKKLKGQYQVKAAIKSVDEDDDENVLFDDNDMSKLGLTDENVKILKKTKAADCKLITITVGKDEKVTSSIGKSLSVTLANSVKGGKVYHVNSDGTVSEVKCSTDLGFDDKYETTFSTSTFSPFIITSAKLKTSTAPADESSDADSDTSGAASTNPETGIALAIAPVVLAAGAVAVVALKKKH